MQVLTVDCAKLAKIGRNPYDIERVSSKPVKFRPFIGVPLNVAENSGCVMVATRAASRRVWSRAFETRGCRQARHRGCVGIRAGRCRDRKATGGRRRLALPQPQPRRAAMLDGEIVKASAGVDSAARGEGRSAGKPSRMRRIPCALFGGLVEATESVVSISARNM